MEGEEKRVQGKRTDTSDCSAAKSFQKYSDSSLSHKIQVKGSTFKKKKKKLDGQTSESRVAEENMLLRAGRLLSKQKVGGGGGGGGGVSRCIDRNLCKRDRSPIITYIGLGGWRGVGQCVVEE